MNRVKEAQACAEAMIARGERVTIGAIRDHLRSLGRGYSLKADQISFALQYLRNTGKVERWTNGRRVQVNGKIYRSIRQAAENEDDVSVNTVYKRIASKSPKFRGWKFVD